VIFRPECVSALRLPDQREGCTSSLDHAVRAVAWVVGIPIAVSLRCCPCPIGKCSPAQSGNVAQ
jgi:hypothetical protein